MYKLDVVADAMDKHLDNMARRSEACRGDAEELMRVINSVSEQMEETLKDLRALLRVERIGDQ